MARLELSVNPEVMERNEKKLQDLAKKTQAKKLELQFTGAKGPAADELLETARMLDQIGQSLGLLYQQTGTAMTNARVDFMALDQYLAELMDGISGITIQPMGGGNGEQK